MYLFVRQSIALAIAVLLVAAHLQAQNMDAAMKLRLAQQYEQSGEWERSVSQYEELYKSDPANFVYFDGLRRGYAQLRLYDKAIALIERRLETNPFDVVLLAALGGLYYDSGSDRKADSSWNLIIKLDPKNVGLYRVVAAQMMEHRLYDRAATMYKTGRSVTGNENVFADELASLYFALQQYGNATAEFIKILRATPQQLPYVQNRIASFTIKDQGLKAAREVARQEVDRTPETVVLRQLLAWLAMEGKDYPLALEEYRTIDKLSRAGGAELFAFARRSSQEGVHNVAARAFQEIVEKNMSPTLVPQARFGYARAMEDLSADNDSVKTNGDSDPNVRKAALATTVAETQKSMQGVLQLYEAIIRDYPVSDLASQSYYRIGLIRMNRLFDLDGALDAFEQVKKSGPLSQTTYDASLRITEVYLRKNDLVASRKECEKLLRIPVPSYQQQAHFSIAELDFFEGQFDSCLARLKSISANLASDLSNDVLLLQYFIEENRSSNPAALVEFAKADLLKRQSKYSESLGRFNELVRQYPTALLVDDAVMKISELRLLLNQPNDALASLEHIVKDMPESILKDRAQMRIGEVFESVLRDKPKAIEAYELLLVKYPNSLYAEEARKRIRLLRGDSI